MAIIELLIKRAFAIFFIRKMRSGERQIYLFYMTQICSYVMTYKETFIFKNISTNISRLREMEELMLQIVIYLHFNFLFIFCSIEN